MYCSQTVYHASSGTISVYELKFSTRGIRKQIVSQHALRSSATIKYPYIGPIKCIRFMDNTL
jgi:hypothetical protein